MIERVNPLAAGFFLHNNLYHLKFGKLKALLFIKKRKMDKDANYNIRNASKIVQFLSTVS